MAAALERPTVECRMQPRLIFSGPFFFFAVFAGNFLRAVNLFGRAECALCFRLFIIDKFRHRTLDRHSTYHPVSASRFVYIFN